MCAKFLGSYLRIILFFSSNLCRQSRRNYIRSGDPFGVFRSRNAKLRAQLQNYRVSRRLLPFVSI